MSMADVSLYLGDEKDKEKEDLIVNHRLFRSGDSEFRMNGKQVRLKDIQESLWKSGIGETEYFVIEQGSIGEFLSLKPIEKRILIEEAAGTAFYKDKKRQAQNKLDNSEQNLIRLEDIVIEVEREKNSLKRQAQAAIRYRKLRENLRELTLVHYREKIDQLEKGQKEVTREYQKSLEKENAIIVQIKDQEQNLSAKRNQAWTLEQSLTDEKEALFSLKSKVSRLEAEKDRDSKRIDMLEERKTKAQQTKEGLKEELEALEKEIVENAETLRTLNQSLTQKKKALQTSEEKGHVSVKEMQASEQEIKRLRDAYLDKISSQTEIKNETAKQERESEILLSQEEKMRAELEKEEALFDEKESQLKKTKSDLSQALRAIEQKESILQDYRISRDKVSIDLEKLDARVSELKSELEKHRHHLKALEKIEANQGRDKMASDLPGALGLFADMVDAEEDHTLLADVLYKEEAKAVLMDAQNFVDMLEGKNIKGQFLLLHPEQKKELSVSVLNDSRILGFLKAHLQLDAQVKPKLSRLNDAVIVKNLKDAVDLWIEFPDSHFITIQGDLLLSSGMLTAGQKQEGIFTLRQEIKGLNKQITRLEEEISPLSQEISHKNAEKSSLEQDTQDVSSSTEDIKRKAEALEKEREFGQAEINRINTQVILIKKEKDHLISEKEGKTSSLNTLILEVEQLKKEEYLAKESIKQHEEKLENLRKQREQDGKKVFELRSSVDLTNEKISNLTHLRQRLVHRKQSTESKIHDLEEEIAKLIKDKDALTESIHHAKTHTVDLQKELKKKEEGLTKTDAQLQDIQNELQGLEKDVQEIREEYEAVKEERVSCEVKKAEAERDLVNLDESCWQELKKTVKEVKAELSIDDLSGEKSEETIEQINDKLEKFKAVNFMAEEEYLEKKKRYEFLSKQKEDLDESIVSTKEAIKKIDQESKMQFIKALIAVNKNFQDVFSLLFQGGAAQVKLTNESNPLESGVEIAVQPPGKRVQSLNLLSGGERALTSLAFFFALFRYKPAPFCILDEVDAALDDTNLARFLGLMKKIKEQTQFILITHNFKSMEVADYIYGTTMAEPNITSIYSVKLTGKEANRVE